jgi:hypothetical protein
MNRIKVFTVLFSLALLCLTFQSIAWGGTIYKEAIVTVDAPVEVPGLHQSVVIGPGTFMFKLLDKVSDRNIIQVFNEDETQLLTMILAVPDYRLQPTDKTIVKFGETSPNSPAAIREWFFPGENDGWEFVYPRSQAMKIAKANNQNVLSTTEESKEPTTLLSAKVTAVTPQGAGR